MKLLGKNLTVVSIHRKGIFDMDAMAFCCENCGRVIVNSAIVQDDDKKRYVIGLDCKKTLIDKPIIDKLGLSGGLFNGKYEIKEYKSTQNTIAKVLSFLDNDKVLIEASNELNWFSVKDTTKPNQFGQMGLNVYSENLGYLFKIGLKDILQSAVNKGIIQKY